MRARWPVQRSRAARGAARLSARTAKAAALTEWAHIIEGIVSIQVAETRRVAESLGEWVLVNLHLGYKLILIGSNSGENGLWKFEDFPIFNVERRRLLLLMVMMIVVVCLASITIGGGA